MSSTRSTPALLVALLIALVTCESALARARQLHPALGGFLQRDLGPDDRDELAGEVVRKFIPRHPLGKNQYANGANLYQYLGSSPMVRNDPTGLWWAGSHATLTIESNGDSLNFNGPGLLAIVASNLFTDFGENKLTHSFHYMRAPDESATMAAIKSQMVMAVLRNKILKLAEQCRAGQYDQGAGRQSLVYLGTLLHIVQDIRAHNLMTMEEHGLSEAGQPLPPIQQSLQRIFEIDFPYGARGASNYPGSLADTKAEIAGIKRSLKGWSSTDLRCCLEEVYESYEQATQVLYYNAVTPTAQLP